MIPATKYKKARNKYGSSIMEAAVGILLLVPVALFLTDIIAVMLAETSIENLVKKAARVAAQAVDPNTHQVNGNTSEQLALNLIKQYPTTSLVPNVPTIDNYVYDGAGPTAQLYLHVTTTCVLPIPVPFIGTKSITLGAGSTQPLVAVLPST